MYFGLRGPGWRVPSRDPGVFQHLEGLAPSRGGDVFLDTWVVNTGCVTPGSYSPSLGLWDTLPVKRGSNKICGFSDHVSPARTFNSMKV